MSFQLVPLTLALLLAATDDGDGCTGPQYRKLKPPTYPPAAVAARIEGESIVRANIDTHGAVTATSLEKSSGNTDLDAAALEVVSEWTFEPRSCDGRAEATYAIVPVNFSLTNDAAQQSFAVDDQAMEFKTIAEQLAYFRSNKDIKQDQRSNMSFYSDIKNLKFWTVIRTPFAAHVAISRVRMERTPTGHREFYSMICEGAADWCQNTRASDLQFHQENPMPVPPARPDPRAVTPKGR